NERIGGELKDDLTEINKDRFRGLLREAADERRFDAAVLCIAAQHRLRTIAIRMDSDARAGLTGPQPWAQKRAKALHDELRWASKVFEPILRLRKNDVIVRFVTSGGPIADLLSC